MVQIWQWVQRRIYITLGIFVSTEGDVLLMVWYLSAKKDEIFIPSLSEAEKESMKHRNRVFEANCEVN